MSGRALGIAGGDQSRWKDVGHATRKRPTLHAAWSRSASTRGDLDRPRGNSVWVELLGDSEAPDRRRMGGLLLVWPDTHPVVVFPYTNAEAPVRCIVGT